MYYFNCILLIDDDPFSTLVAEEILSQLYISNEIISVHSSKEALDYIYSFHSKHKCYPELILVDINMPEIDGFMFVQKLYEKIPPDKKSDFFVSALSSSTNPDDKLKMLALGANYYLSKPLTKEKIKSLLDAIN